jgi:DNA polymerase (family X)
LGGWGSAIGSKIELTMATNQQIAAHLKLISQLKTLDGDNRFSVKAYDDAAGTIAQLTISDGYQSIQGVGEKIAAVIQEFRETGTSSTLQDLETRWPAEIMTLTCIQNIGPKKAFKLFQKGYANFDQLHQAALKGELDVKLTGSVLLAALKKSGRHPRETVVPIAEYLAKNLAEVAGVEDVQVAGSVRRQAKDAKDIDLVARISSEDVRPKLMERFAFYGNGTYEGGDLKGSIQYPLSSEQVIQVDLWIADKSYWGSLLNHATGSKDHNIALRTLAKSRGMIISEYGIHDAEGNKLGGESERDLYRILDIPYVEPKDRTGIIPEGHYT